MNYTDEKVANLLALMMLGEIAEAIEKEEKKAKDSEEKHDTEEHEGVLSFDDFLKHIHDEVEGEKEEEVSVRELPEGHVSLEFEGMKIAGHKKDVIETLESIGKLTQEFTKKG